MKIETMPGLKPDPWTEELYKLNREYLDLQFRMKPIQDRMDEISRRKEDVLSRQFIAENGITRQQVEMSSDTGEWFYTIDSFSKWLLVNSDKKWAEWNGRIYYTSDILDGRMPIMPGMVKHLQP